MLAEFDLGDWDVGDGATQLAAMRSAALGAVMHLYSRSLPGPNGEPASDQPDQAEAEVRQNPRPSSASPSPTSASLEPTALDSAGEHADAEGHKMDDHPSVNQHPVLDDPESGPPSDGRSSSGSPAVSPSLAARIPTPAAVGEQAQTACEADEGIVETQPELQEQTPTFPEVETAPASEQLPPESAVDSRPTSPAFVSALQPSIDLETAREFMEYYCLKFDFPSPEVHITSSQNYSRPGGGPSVEWHAALYVKGHRMGIGTGQSKRDTQSNTYINAARWLAQTDPALWARYLEEMAARRKESLLFKDKILSSISASPQAAPSVDMKVSERLDDMLRRTATLTGASELHKRAEKLKVKQEAMHQRMEKQIRATKLDAKSDGKVSGRQSPNAPTNTWQPPPKSRAHLDFKSGELKTKLEEYRRSAYTSKMREARAALPVTACAERLLQRIDEEPVVVVVSLDNLPHCRVGALRCRLLKGTTNQRV